MKLSTKSSLYFAAAALFVFILSIGVVYPLLEYFIREEADEELLRQKDLVTNWINNSGGYGQLSPPSYIGIEIFPEKASQDGYFFGDTMRYDALEDEFAPYRQMGFNYTHTGETRYIVLRHALVESEEFIETLALELLLVFIGILITFYIINTVLLKKLWQPFFATLNQVRHFNFKTPVHFKKEESGIDEFDQLNQTLADLTQKLHNDYQTLKEFSENASHEMQTPLAIIQSKLEIMMQKQDNEQNSKALQTIFDATKRMSRLHHDLSLLTRLENREFEAEGALSLRTILERQLELFEDIISFKGLTLSTEILADKPVTGNKYLLEILLSNLFNNAIKHNTNDGSIQVKLDAEKLIICNTGQKPDGDPEELFQRFKKGKPKQDSNGLGLAIVAQIAQLHDLSIRYSFQNELHCIEIR